MFWGSGQDCMLIETYQHYCGVFVHTSRGRKHAITRLLTQLTFQHSNISTYASTHLKAALQYPSALQREFVFPTLELELGLLYRGHIIREVLPPAGHKVRPRSLEPGLAFQE